MGTGSNTHQMTQSMVTAAVIANAALLLATEVSTTMKYISSAAEGPAKSAIVFVFTWLYVRTLIIAVG